MSLAIVVAAGGLTGTLAWAGHGAGGAGPAAIIHPAADFLHLVAAAAWVGGLLPLAFLLAAAGRTSSGAVARAASLRFSAYGIAAVGVLLLTGATNTWYLAGSIRALTATDYGHLLLVKIALFLLMLALATVNRVWLTPALAAGTDEKPARHAQVVARLNRARKRAPL
jgi:putative copper resistance protein D